MLVLSQYSTWFHDLSCGPWRVLFMHSFSLCSVYYLWWPAWAWSPPPCWCWCSWSLCWALPGPTWIRSVFSCSSFSYRAAVLRADLSARFRDQKLLLFINMSKVQGEIFMIHLLWSFVPYWNHEFFTVFRGFFTSFRGFSILLFFLGVEGSVGDHWELWDLLLSGDWVGPATGAHGAKVPFCQIRVRPLRH